MKRFLSIRRHSKVSFSLLGQMPPVISPSLRDALVFERTVPSHQIPKYMSTPQRTFLAEANVRMLRKLETFPVKYEARTVYDILRDASEADRAKYGADLRADELLFLDAMDRQLDLCQDELGAHFFTKLVGDIEHHWHPTSVHARNFSYYAACTHAGAADVDAICTGVDRVAAFWNRRAQRNCVRYVRDAYRFEQVVRYALMNID